MTVISKENPKRVLDFYKDCGIDIPQMEENKNQKKNPYSSPVFVYEYCEHTEEEFELKELWIRFLSSGIEDSIQWDRKQIVRVIPFFSGETVLDYTLELVKNGCKGNREKENLHFMDGNFSLGSSLERSSLVYEMFNCGLLVPKSCFLRKG